MRRRAADYRRPVRSNLSSWIWALLGIFSIAGIFLFVMHHQYHGDDQAEHPTLGRDSKNVETIHKQPLNSTMENLSGRLLEQMTLAKAYIVLAKEHNNLHLAWQLSSKIRRCQVLLSKEQISVEEAIPMIQTLSSLILKAQDSHYDLATTLVTMKTHIQALEQRAIAASVQKEVFGMLSADSVPRYLHCLEMKLTADWVKKREPPEEMMNPLRLVDINLYHFCLFSDNLLAVSVAINSTVSNADHPRQLVFHVITDKVNFPAMHAWFSCNDFKGSTIEVQKVEVFKSKKKNKDLRFYVPEIYPQLEKVVYLDDDVVVQKDLTPLFSIDLHGNIIGAVETCLDSSHRLHNYLNFSNPLVSSKFDPQACGWAFGLNVFDLIAWKKTNVTARYEYWQEQNADRSVWSLGTLPPALLAFYGLVEPLDRRWHVLGLGYDGDIDNRLIESAAVVHFNGNLKPWGSLGISRYKPLWERFLNQSNTYIQDCLSSQ